MERRMAELKSYYPGNEPSPGYFYRGNVIGSACDRCGAIVSLEDGDRRLHDRWHDDEGAALAFVRQAVRVAANVEDGATQREER